MIVGSARSTILKNQNTFLYIPILTYVYLLFRKLNGHENEMDISINIIPLKVVTHLAVSEKRCRTFYDLYMIKFH